MEASVICSVIANAYVGKREALTSGEIYYLEKRK